VNAESAVRSLIPDRGTAVVGEVAQAHDGSLGTAHAYVEAIAATGADAVKFQTHLAHAESTRAEPWRVPFSPQDTSRYDYWARMEFTASQWAGLKDHAHDVGLAFVSSPFSLEAVDLLGAVGVDGLKIASGEVSNLELVAACGALGVAVLVSSGLSTFAELDAAVACLREADAAFAVLQCSSTYPCPPEDVGLNLLATLGARYGCPVGLSDHSGTIYPGLAAVALGAKVIEIHVTLTREGFGPDVSSSVTTTELRQLVEGTRFISTMLDSPVDKDQAADERSELRSMFTRSLVARYPIRAGHVLGPEDLVAKKPGGGIEPAQRTNVIGRRVSRSLDTDERLRPDDVDPPLGAPD